VGRATTRAWSPLLKQYLAIGQVRTEHAAPGGVLHLEVTPEWERRRIPATVTKTPFFAPERKRKP
jgi:aminomethyltransferase